MCELHSTVANVLLIVFLKKPYYEAEFFIFNPAMINFLNFLKLFLFFQSEELSIFFFRPQDLIASLVPSQWIVACACNFQSYCCSRCTTSAAQAVVIAVNSGCAAKPVRGCGAGPRPLGRSAG